MKFVLITVLMGIVAFATASDEQFNACLCPRLMAPVCGTNGVTYSNTCEFNCVRDQLVARGEIGLKIMRGGDCNGPEIPEFLQEF